MACSWAPTSGTISLLPPVVGGQQAVGRGRDGVAARVDQLGEQGVVGVVGVDADVQGAGTGRHRRSRSSRSGRCSSSRPLPPVRVPVKVVERDGTQRAQRDRDRGFRREAGDVGRVVHHDRAGLVARRRRRRHGQREAARGAGRQRERAAATRCRSCARSRCWPGTGRARPGRIPRWRSGPSTSRRRVGHLGVAVVADALRQVVLGQVAVGRDEAEVDHPDQRDRGVQPGLPGGTVKVTAVL